jgi:MFS family permease
MKYQHRVLGMLSLLAVITYLDRVCIAVAGPRMQDALHISPEAWGWVTSVFFLSYSAFEIPTGALGDRIGPRRVLTRVVAWWSVFTTLTGTVSNYYVLLLVRFCFGAGAAANVASAVSSVVFGYMVGYFGNYNTPFIPMVALLSLGALLWLRVDPTLELLPEALPDESLAALASLVPIGESARP